MRRDTYVVSGIAIIAIGIGAFLFLYGGSSFSSASQSTATDTVAEAQPISTPVAVPFTELARGTHSKVATRVNYLITSTDQLAKLWKMITATSTPPKIDFKTQEVISVFAGQKSTGGNSIVVASITDMGNTRTVAVKITKPSPNCIVTESFTNPYQVVAVARSDASLAHTDTEDSLICK